MSISPLTVFADDVKIICDIRAKKETISQGEIPQITVTITNKSSKEQVLVGSLDGSDVGWRFPKCGFEVMDANGKLLPPNQINRCRNMNILKVSDFVRVSSDRNFNPFGKGFFRSHHIQRFKKLPPGTYFIRFYYQTAGKGIQNYLGDERMTEPKNTTQEIQKLCLSVPKINIKSNKIKIMINN